MMTVDVNGFPSPSKEAAPLDNRMSDALDKHVRQLLKAKAIPTCIINLIEELVPQMPRLHQDNTHLALNKIC